MTQKRIFATKATQTKKDKGDETPIHPITGKPMKI